MPYPSHVPAHSEPSPAAYHVYCPACGSWVAGAVAHATGMGLWAVACPRCGSGAPGRINPDSVLPFGPYSGRAVSSLATREGRDYLAYFLHTHALGPVDAPVPTQGLRLAILLHLGWLSAERAQVAAGPDLSRLRAELVELECRHDQAETGTREEEAEKAAAESQAKRQASWMRQFEAGRPPRRPQQFHQYQRPAEPLPPPPPVAGRTLQHLPEWVAVLGVTWPTTAKQVRRAYRRLSKGHHPDVGGSEAEMQKINAAHDAAEAWVRRAVE